MSICSPVRTGSPCITMSARGTRRMTARSSRCGVCVAAFGRRGADNAAVFAFMQDAGMFVRFKSRMAHEHGWGDPYSAGR